MSPSITHLTWHHYAIPLSNTFTTNHEVLTTRQGIIVEIHFDNGIVGIGESAPLPEFSGGTIQDVLTALPSIAARLHHTSCHEALAFLQTQTNAALTTLTYALETALLDALGQVHNTTISQLLTPAEHTASPRTQIKVNAVIGTTSTSQAIQQAQALLQQGFRCLKLKVDKNIQQSWERVAAVRQAIGSNIELRLDANEAWNFTEALDILTRCTPLQIQYVEQPLPRHDLTNMARLRQEINIPLAVDEALADPASAQAILAAKAADVFIIKPQLAGGLYNSQRMIHAATQQGIQSVVTSTIEAGIGVSAALHLVAATTDITLACGLATLPMLAEDLLVAPLSLEAGYISVPTGAGLGIQLDRAALTTYIITSTRG